MIWHGELTTVKNDYYNIEAGWKVNVTWLILNRVFEFENRLPEETRSKLHWNPINGKNNPGSKVVGGDFNGFPHYSTFFQESLGPSQANLLSNT
eukprot:UN07915